MNQQAKIIIGVLAAGCLVLAGILLIRGDGVSAADEDGRVAALRDERPAGAGEAAAGHARVERDPVRAVEPARDRSLLDRMFGPDSVTVVVPAGTEVRVALAAAFSSREMRAGDTFPVVLAGDLVAGGRIVAPTGSPGTGRVADIDHADRVKGREQVTLEIVDLTIGGDARAVRTNTVFLEARGTKQRDAAVIGGAAAAGALIGAIAGGGDGAAKGAAIGGAGGTGVVLSTQGEDIDLPRGHGLEFRLADDLSVEMEPVPGVARR